MNNLIELVLNSEVKGAVKLLAGDSGSSGGSDHRELCIPEIGLSAKEILNVLKNLHKSETAAEDGKAFAYTYTTSTDMQELSSVLAEAHNMFTESSGITETEHDTVLKAAWNEYMHTNALNPMMYPSLRKFETEIVGMTAWMTNGPPGTVGSVTSGGTESILMAVKTYRDFARKTRPHITKPNMIVPITIHPAFEKAGHYFDVELIHVQLASDFRVDTEAVRRAVNRNTILIVGSASQYCHGVVDPIEELSKIASAKALPLHVDACFGGFMLP